MSSEILSIKVEHVEDVLETYNVLQVARSTTGIGGPFTVLSPNVTLYAWQRTYYFTYSAGYCPHSKAYKR